MSDGLPIFDDEIRFTLDGRDVAARPGETIWQVASRNGTDIPHLCYSTKPGYRPDGRPGPALTPTGTWRTFRGGEHSATGRLGDPYLFTTPDTEGIAP